MASSNIAANCLGCGCFTYKHLTVTGCSVRGNARLIMLNNGLLTYLCSFYSLWKPFAKLKQPQLPTACTGATIFPSARRPLERAQLPAQGCDADTRTASQQLLGIWPRKATSVRSASGAALRFKPKCCSARKVSDTVHIQPQNLASKWIDHQQTTCTYKAPGATQRCAFQQQIASAHI